MTEETLTSGRNGATLPLNKGFPFDNVGDKLIQLSKPVWGDATEYERTTLQKPLPVQIQLTDSPANNAFGYLRAEGRQTLGFFHNEYGDENLAYYFKTTGTATHAHNSTLNTTDLTCPASSSKIAQSKRFFRYQPGKSELVFTTSIRPTLQGGMVIDQGFSDGSNGLLFRTNGSTNQLVRQSTAGDSNLTAGQEVVNQTNWNKDTLDGSGDANNPSGINLDNEKVQIFGLDFQALYAGRVRLYFDIGGKYIEVHEFNHANEIAKPYIAYANLPVRYSITCDATVTGSPVFSVLCFSVDSEGGTDLQLGYPKAIYNQTAVSVGTGWTPVLSIRPKATFNSITYRGDILPLRFAVYTDSQDVQIKVTYGGTPDAGSVSWADWDTTYSAVEYDESATSITGGYDNIDSGFATTSGGGGGGGGGNRNAGNAADSITSFLPLALDIDGAHPTSPLTDVLSIQAKVLSGTTSNVIVILEVVELR